MSCADSGWCDDLEGIVLVMSDDGVRHGHGSAAWAIFAISANDLVVFHFSYT